MTYAYTQKLRNKKNPNFGLMSSFNEISKHLIYLNYSIESEAVSLISFSIYSRTSNSKQICKNKYWFKWKINRKYWIRIKDQ